MRRPASWAIRSSKCARHSRSTYSAPSDSASARIRLRSSSEPLNSPPSQAGRQVTIDRPAAPGERAGDVRIADRVEPQLDQIGVGDRVALLAQLGRRGGGDGDAKQWFRHKKSLFNRVAEEARKTRSLWRRCLGGCLFSRAPIPPPGVRAHGCRRLEGVGSRAEGRRHQNGQTIANPGDSCQTLM